MVLLLGTVLASPLAGQAPAAQGGVTLDPERVVTAEACGECHVSTFEVWRKTPHATGFKTLHRKASAEEIAGRMGLKLIKRDSMCLDCHYTSTVRNEQLRAVSGVSCESCHGAARDWIDVHNDYGGKGIDHTNETGEHRAMRLAKSEAAGMRRPGALYDLANQCFQCHTVPREKLVNVGRHSAGSADFELLAWTQGDIRHNFLDSFLNGDGTENVQRPPEHRRRLFVLGRALDLEHSLRGVAQATENGVYLKAMQRRVRNAISELRLIARLGGDDLRDVDTMLSTAKSVRPRLGQADALVAAAEGVAAAARGFLERHDGTRLAALDPLVEGRQDEIDRLLEELEAEDAQLADAAVIDGAAVDAAAAGTDTSGAATGTTALATGDGAAATGGSTATPGTTPRPAVAAIPAEGEKRTHIRPRSSHDTLDASACQKCHGDQHAWWYDDPHYTAADAFLEGGAKQVKIARLYGISPSRMARGDSLCMDCHGTVATAKAKREVQDGVSCQSCHGPGADFLEPHQEGDESLGRQRPGFLAALDLGMRDLRNMEVRMANCASCHYITDPRLISAGHPSGADFDIVGGMASVQHWTEPVEPAGTLTAAWTAQQGKRGPIPKVRQARLAQAAGPAAGSGNTVSGGTVSGNTVAGGVAVDGAGAKAPRPRAFAPRPNRRGTAGTASPEAGDAPASSLDLPPALEVEDDTPIEDILHLLRDRLQLLYEAVRGTVERPTPSSTAPPSDRPGSER